MPIFKGSEIVGLIGVANRPGGYTGEEVRSLETISRTVGVLYDNYRQILTRLRLEEERTASNRNSAKRRKWKSWDNLPEALPMTSTTCSWS